MVLARCKCGSDDIHFKTIVTVKNKGDIAKESVYVKCKKCGIASEPIKVEYPTSASYRSMEPVHLLAKCEAAKAWNDMQGLDHGFYS